MSPENLIEYIEYPEKLSLQSLNEIENLVNTYPFFQTVRLLHTKNLQNAHKQIDQKDLHLTAAYVTDRKVLYYLLNKFSYTVSSQEESIQSKPGSEKISQAVPAEKDVKDSMQENISDTLQNQLLISNLENSADIELVPGLAIDIRKQYGEEPNTDPISDDETDLVAAATAADLFELDSISPADQSVEEKEIQLGVQEASLNDGEFEFVDEASAMQEDLLNAQAKLENPHGEEPVELNNIEDDEHESHQVRDNTGNKEKSFLQWLESVDKVDLKDAFPVSNVKEVDKNEKIIEKGKEELKLEMDYDINKLATSSTDHTGSSNTSEKIKSQVSLINRFIEKNPKIKPNKQTTANEDFSKESVREHESFITDTLAEIYVRQGNYAKAIFAYEKLSLKYPEKNTYFADQILEIKKLTNK